VPELVSRAGGIPVGGAVGGRSVTTGWDELPAADLVVVAPCGFGLDAAVEQSASVAARLPGVPLIAIDSARFVVQPGPSLVDGVEALAWAFHPGAVKEPPPGKVARV
jgi:iron complex transport system substrate-binding protein